MASIGYDEIGGGTPTLTSSENQALIDAPAYVYTAEPNQEIFKLWVYVGGLGGDGSGVEVGVANVSSGTSSAPLVT